MNYIEIKAKNKTLINFDNTKELVPDEISTIFKDDDGNILSIVVIIDGLKVGLNFDNAKEAEEALKKIRSNLFKGV